MQGFKHIYTVEVRFRDIDMLGHVNNAVYFTYMEAARIDYSLTVFYGGDSSKFNNLELILAEIHCTFKKPIVYGQRVQVGTRVVKLGGSSYTLESQISADDELAALGRAVMVHYDYQAGKSARIPEAIRQRVQAFEGLGQG